MPSAALSQKMFAPVHGYISIETFEIRKEFVLRLDTVAERLDMENLSERKMIDSLLREQIEQQLAKWLKEKCPLKVEGETLEMELDRVHFVRPDPVKGMVVDERENVPASEVIIGVVFAAALDGPVKSVQVHWDVFPSDDGFSVVAMGTRKDSKTKKVTPDSAQLTWVYKGGLEVEDLLSLPALPPSKAMKLPVLSVILCMLALALIALALRWRDRTPAWLGLALVILLASAWLVRNRLEIDFPAKAPAISPQLADDVVYALLRNTYRAFDYRRESDIYDVLAKSVAGDLLTKVYLEVQHSLALASQGGARARVYELDLRECIVAKDGGKGKRGIGFDAKCSWVAIGTVSHWGHTHDRVNRYQAEISVIVVDGHWKLKKLDLLSQERSIKKSGVKAQ
ncbi:MAG: hypothetical protein L3J39_11830 [Verrucomicrobiales bacterium]|nr:hypothetical protein [Verrucomicrobiales bacterium]